MKKFLLVSVLMAGALIGVAGLHSMSNTNGVPPSIGSSGGTLNGGSTIQLGVNPGAQAPLSQPFLALVNLTQYDAVVLVAGRGVSKTATVGDVNFVGFATETTAYGSIAQIARFGVIRARVGTSATAGDRFVLSANAGFLTPTSAVTATLYTSVSGTPVVARSFETYTYATYTPNALVIIGPY